jgi:hypothetical protein
MVTELWLGYIPGHICLSLSLLVVEQIPSLQRRLQVWGVSWGMAWPQNLLLLCSATWVLFTLPQADVWSCSEIHVSAFEL